MTKILDLKDWLSISDAARQLSNLFKEELREVDVLQLALDRKLAISVRFAVPQEAQPGKLLSRSESWWAGDTLFEGSAVEVMEGEAFVVSDDEVLELESKVVILSGIADLPMVGCEQDKVESAYRLAANEPPGRQADMNSTFVVLSDGKWFRLLERRSDTDLGGNIRAKKPSDNFLNFEPAVALPPNSALVVRTSSVADLLQRVQGPADQMEKPLGARERKTLLMIIAALAKEAKFDLKTPSKAASILEKTTELLGIPVSRRAIEDHLKRVSAALASRASDGS